MSKGVVGNYTQEQASFWSRNKKWLIPLIVCFVILVVSIGVLVGMCTSWMFSAKGETEACLDQFMLAGQAQDIDGSLALCVPQMQNDDIEYLIEYGSGILFEKYDAINTTSFEVQTSGGKLQQHWMEALAIPMAQHFPIVRLWLRLEMSGG